MRHQRHRALNNLKLSRLFHRAILGLALLAGIKPLTGFAATDAFPAQLLTFSAAKEQQARQLAADLKLEVSPDIWTFFAAAKQGNWPDMTNAYARLRWRSSQYQGSYNDPTVSTPVWQTVIEAQTAYEAFAAGGQKYPLAFGEGIIQSIPPGSIYFGGTDPGRGLVTALCAAHAQAKPFYTLTQNALADNRYLDYLRSMYGRELYIPTTNDLQKAFQFYAMDLQRRAKHDEEFPQEPRQIKPGENHQKTADGQITISGQVSVMEINGLLVKQIFNHNPNCEFYVEESFPLDWMYPQLSPHGLIFKLNRAPLFELTPAMMEEDHAFWTKQCDAMLGNWLTPQTTLSNVCAFATKVYGQKDWSQFTGDPGYVTNGYATRMFSKLRSSGGGLYQWRLKHQVGGANRLRAETDYAFRQAFALCPTSPEAVYRYVNFLMDEKRINDAIRLVRTAWTLAPDNQQFQSLLSQLLDTRRQQNQKATQ